MLNSPTEIALAVLIGTVLVLLVFAAMLHLLPRLGWAGRWLSDRACEAPLLDAVVFVFTVLPQLVAIGLAIGIVGPMAPFVDVAVHAVWWLIMAIVGQCVALMLWTVGHEFWHRASPKGQLRRLAREERIVFQVNRSVGRVRNHAAVWWTAIAVPVFAIVRVLELMAWPPLVWLVRFPRYEQAEWVNVSRHKFEGLVGHDRIWCLYCDWMTGIWSLGSEMLRNVESFWCPVRFHSEAKCENCRIDFPDVAEEWVRAPGSAGAAAGSSGMPGVVAKLREKYPGPLDSQGRAVNAWFGHPVRLTVRGELPDEPGGSAQEGGG